MPRDPFLWVVFLQWALKPRHCPGLFLFLAPQPRLRFVEMRARAGTVWTLPTRAGSPLMRAARHWCAQHAKSASTWFRLWPPRSQAPTGRVCLSPRDKAGAAVAPMVDNHCSAEELTETGRASGKTQLLPRGTRRVLRRDRNWPVDAEDRDLEFVACVARGMSALL